MFILLIDAVESRVELIFHSPMQTDVVLSILLYMQQYQQTSLLSTSMVPD